MNKLRWWKPKHGTEAGWRYECLRNLINPEFKLAWKAYINKSLTYELFVKLVINSFFTRLLPNEKLFALEDNLKKNNAR